jgi:hypothetical protein
VSATRFAIIPDVVFDALENRIITREMFDCLVLLYRWREHGSNLVRSVSAERIAVALSLHYEEPPALNTVRRWMRGLMYSKWFQRTYRSGRKKPYDVHLNFWVGDHFLGQGGIEGGDNGCEKTAIEGGVKSTVSYEEIVPWQQTQVFQGGDKTTDEGGNEGGIAGGQKVANNKAPSVPRTVLHAADAAGDIDHLHGLFSPSAPAGGALAAGLENHNQHLGPESQRRGQEKLLTALRRVASRKLKNTRSVPKTLKPTFELIETAHGFDAVVRDFERWCEQNRDRHPKFPLFEYAKQVQDRLGEPPVPDARVAKSNPNVGADSFNSLDEAVESMVQDVYGCAFVILKNTKDVRRALEVYEYDYVLGALQEHVQTHNQDRDVTTFFSEGGRLTLIVPFKEQALDGAAKYLVRNAGGEFSPARVWCEHRLNAKSVVRLSEENEKWSQQQKKKTAR